jgi:lysophospholipase L1-like esterase
MLVLIGVVSIGAYAEDASPHARWEAVIAKFEEQDAESPPPQGANLFVGSSSIRMWDLDESFPEFDVINRGFGGSQIADSTYFAERLVIKHAPKVVVLYAGDNDIAGGKDAEQVHANYKAFVATVHEALPETTIAFIAIKPSTARWELVDEMRTANALIEAETEEDERLVFIDIDPLMLNDEGTPREDYLLGDGLHLTRDGYKVWAKAVRPHLHKD